MAHPTVRYLECDAFDICLQQASTQASQQLWHDNPTPGKFFSTMIFLLCETLLSFEFDEADVVSEKTDGM